MISIKVGTLSRISMSASQRQGLTGITNDREYTSIVSGNSRLMQKKNTIDVSPKAKAMAKLPS